MIQETNGGKKIFVQEIADLPVSSYDRQLALHFAPPDAASAACFVACCCVCCPLIQVSRRQQRKTKTTYPPARVGRLLGFLSQFSKNRGVEMRRDSLTSFVQKQDFFGEATASAITWREQLDQKPPGLSILAAMRQPLLAVM